MILKRSELKNLRQSLPEVSNDRLKLASRAYECLFIDYAVNSKAYRFYNLKGQVIIKSNDVGFFKDKFPFKLRNSGGSSGWLASNSQYRPSMLDDDELEPRRSKRARTVKDFGYDFYAYILEEDPNSF